MLVVNESALAQFAARPFLPPPKLVEKGQLQTLAAVEKRPLGTACNPSGDVTRDGQTVTLNLQVEKRENEIYNPGNPDGAKDRVRLRSYGCCLSGPLLEVNPSNTLRVNLDNRLDKIDPSCPGGRDPAGGTPGCFNTINMHFHGLHVSPAGNSDNVLLNIGPKTIENYITHDITTTQPASSTRR
ncbi:cupredoxin domain-containing protein [Ralstonia pseudosolanacearum]|uniref:hypothetical protein n=1 Tax=Ralstonia pseudosolanacearum TaxID=1310165 RepID=UPI0018D06CA0|nr:hypothetical protein [Ralstonia pseudosolanacearum]UWD88439.1 hypothetical protein NY025_07025 [Ralstonia pseudosolanacearum]